MRYIWIIVDINQNWTPNDPIKFGENILYSNKWLKIAFILSWCRYINGNNAEIKIIIAYGIYIFVNFLFKKVKKLIGLLE